PAVAAVGFFGVGGVEGGEFAEAGGDQAVGGDAFGHQIFGHRDGAGGGQFPVGGELGVGDGALVGVPIDAQHPVDIGWNFGFELQDGRGQRVEIGGAGGLYGGLAGIEKHFGLEHEPVADDADIGAAFENLAQ